MNFDPQKHLFDTVAQSEVLQAPPHPDCAGISRSSTCAAELQAAEQGTFFFFFLNRTPFLLGKKKKTDRKTDYSKIGIWQTFSQN